MTARSIVRTGQASSCYFRTTAEGDARKALVQIDERCNLRCAHCFVSATRAGRSMPYDDITGLLIPRLKECRVDRVTLTGGEPTIHPRFIEIVRALRGAGMQVGFCTNATTLADARISELASIGGVHANVSLDGFRPESHGRFRGDRVGRTGDGYRYDHAFCSHSLRDLITDCGYLHQPREQKLSDHSALTLRFNLAPPQTLPVSDPAAVTEPATLF